MEEKKQEIISDQAAGEEMDALRGKSRLRCFILGVLIGLAVIAPGISGSTIAIILGLYTAVLYANGHLFTEFKRCFSFLYPLSIGTIVGFLGGFFVIQWIFGPYVFQMVCLFAGLMIGAFPALITEIKGQRTGVLRTTLLTVGILVPIAVALISWFLLPESSTTDTYTSFPFWLYLLYLPLGYVVSITQVVPGLSATAILMAVGQFGPLLNSVHVGYILENPQVILLYLTFALGFFGGVFSLSRMLSNVLTNHKVTSFFLIVGLSFGSIASMFLSGDMLGIYQSWVTEGTFSIGGLLVGILLLLIGAAISYALVWYEKKHDIHPA